MHILGERKRIKRRILKENPDLGTDILNCKRADLFSIQLGVLIIAILLLVFALFATFISSKKLLKP